MRANDDCVDAARQAMRRGDSGLTSFPGLLKKMLREECWKRRIIIKTGQLVEFSRIEDFVTTLPLEGLGATMDLVKRICGADAEALDLLDRALKGGERQGERRDIVDNVNEVRSSPDGNSAGRALRKLRDSAPEMHARVIAGEMSPHAAMVAAGFRSRAISVPDDPVKAAIRLKRHFQGNRLDELIQALETER
jgi:hypothetical protein